MLVGVLGGTGQVGRLVVAELERRGHTAVVLCRSAPRAGEHRCIDLTDCEGLDEAMSGLDALVDVLNGSQEILVDGLRRALDAAAKAGVGHVVSLSILGCDCVPLGYYRVKGEQEAVVRESGIPWSVVRANQFHSLLDAVFAASAKRGVLPLLRVPLQPVDAGEVARALVDRVLEGPEGGVSHFAGPRVERADRLARSWAEARGVRRMPLPVPALGGTLRAVRSGALTDPGAPHGSITFEEWLAQ
jgi:uncharacterized protein YbjT (DUF2867 family)